MGLFSKVSEGDRLERERGVWDEYEVVGINETFGDRVSVEARPVNADNPLSDQYMEPVFEREFSILNNTVPDPREVHQSRSEYAQKQDEARDARITTDPEQYASDPNSFDFPGVDTGPTFREVEGDFDEDSFLENMLGMK